MRLTGHVTPLGERKTTYSGSVGKPEGKSHLGDINAEGRIILKWILQKCVGLDWIYLLGQDTVQGSPEYDELSLWVP
jgi:hypothetical protein